MDIATFLDFRNQLRDNLRKRPEVTGLVFLGSSAKLSRVDEWSDHDFFVFTQHENCEGFRSDLSWLPDHEEISIAVRETDHGLKVVYRNGHVLEFAIFDEVWPVLGVNDFEVAFNTSDITERLTRAKVDSIPRLLDADRELSLFLAHLLIGVGRIRRGELLSANQFINSFCLTSTLKLIEFFCSPLPGTEVTQDNQNSFRRFEIRYPEISSEITKIQLLPLESAAKALLELLELCIGEKLSEEQLDKVAVVRARLKW
ncbi:MAG: hypothetical protein KGQ38_03025 [Actinomycetales bacterium]|nr:hypothetical protein [Actinomycetales bacterium]